MTLTKQVKNRSVDVYLASPRGFCAGVDLAVDIVELALKKYGTPVYVKHQIVHNPIVVADTERKGAITVEQVDDLVLHIDLVLRHIIAPETVHVSY